jgi:UTP--glucose-1-phosphate uridylyltransferase
MLLKQAILPIAGLGTRFLPWTKTVPKELLPLGNEPIVAKLVDECLSVGITDICLVISKGKELIPQYFQEDAALRAELQRRGKEKALAPLDKYQDVSFHVVYQDEQLGDGHALLQAADWVKSDAVAVLFGDDLIHGEKNGLQQLAAAHETARNTDPSGQMPAVLCLENVKRELVSKYGIVDISPAESDGRLKRVRGLVEKPMPEDAPSTLGIVGKYIVPRSTFEVLPTVESGHGGEIRLIDALIKQLGTVPIYGWEAEGKRLDTGTPEGYKEAVALLG